MYWFGGNIRGMNTHTEKDRQKERERENRHILIEKDELFIIDYHVFFYVFFFH